MFCHLSGDVPEEPLFEGFPITGEGFNPEIANRRISVLQAARPSDALASVRTVASVGFCRRVRSGPLDSRDRTGPLVVV